MVAQLIDYIVGVTALILTEKASVKAELSNLDKEMEGSNEEYNNRVQSKKERKAKEAYEMDKTEKDKQRQEAELKQEEAEKEAKKPFKKSDFIPGTRAGTGEKPKDGDKKADSKDAKQLDVAKSDVAKIEENPKVVEKIIDSKDSKQLRSVQSDLQEQEGSNREVHIKYDPSRKSYEYSSSGPKTDSNKISQRSTADQSRHWYSRPGKLQEHIDPSTTPKLRRRQLHYPTTASPRTFTQKASFAKESVFPKDNETREYEYEGEDRDDDVTDVPTSSRIFNSVKVGWGKTKEGISHGLGSAGHRLGLWDEETSTAFPKGDEEHGQPGLASNGTPNSNASDATKHVTPMPTPILASPPPPSHEINHTNDITQGHPTSPETHDVAHPLLNDKLNHIKDTAKSTAGLSTMGVIVFLIIGLWVACIFKRSWRKRGRYAHLADDSEAWKLTTNGEGGVLAHEFDEFGMRSGSVGGSDDEEAQRKRSH